MPSSVAGPSSALGLLTRSRSGGSSMSSSAAQPSPSPPSSSASLNSSPPSSSSRPRSSSPQASPSSPSSSASRHPLSLLASDHSTVEESSGHGQKWPVLLRLSNWRRRLEKPGSWSWGRKWSLLCINSFLDLLSLLRQTMSGSCQVSQASLATASQHLHSLLHISQVECILEMSTGVLSDLCNLHHLLQLV